MKILILHSYIDADARPDQLDTLDQVECIAQSLKRLWHETCKVSFDTNFEKLLSTIERLKPDFVFNLVEDVLNVWKLVYLATWLLDFLNIPYSGCNNRAMFVTTDKVLTKRILKAHSILTPNWADLTNIDTLGAYSTYIIKAVSEEASIGIDYKCIVSWIHDIKNKIMEKQNVFYTDFFAEEYIDWREFNISIMDIAWIPTVLPHAEIIFSNFEKEKKIVWYDAKWNENSFEYKNTNRSFCFDDKEKDLLAKLSQITLECWHIFDLSWYARVDFRVDNNHNIFVLEINSNPCISSNSWFFAACQKHWMTYDDMIQNIVGYFK